MMDKVSNNTVLYNLKATESTDLIKKKNWLKAQHSENEDHGIRSHHFMGNR